jgi:steroid delta-isomerase-like uncharacterized protein
MSTENEALTRRWFEEVWNQGKAEAIDEMFAPEVVAHGLGDNGGDLHGVEPFKRFQAIFKGAFPDLRIDIEDILSQDDRVAVRYACSGTHSGDHLGIPATGKTVRFTGMTFARWKDGRIVEGWNNVDLAKAFLELGIWKAADPGEGSSNG